MFFCRLLREDFLSLQFFQAQVSTFRFANRLATMQNLVFGRSQISLSFLSRVATTRPLRALRTIQICRLNVR